MMIETASFNRPSPKTMLNNLGYLSALIIVNAATASEAHIVELNCNNCLVGIISAVPSYL